MSKKTVFILAALAGAALLLSAASKSKAATTGKPVLDAFIMGPYARNATGYPVSAAMPTKPIYGTGYGPEADPYGLMTGLGAGSSLSYTANVFSPNYF